MSTFDEVMKELEEIYDESLTIQTEPVGYHESDDPDRPFKMEYAHEYLTESNSHYKRRNYDA